MWGVAARLSPVRALRPEALTPEADHSAAPVLCRVVVPAVVSGLPKQTSRTVTQESRHSSTDGARHARRGRGHNDVGRSSMTYPMPSDSHLDVHMLRQRPPRRLRLSRALADWAASSLIASRPGRSSRIACEAARAISLGADSPLVALDSSN